MTRLTPPIGCRPLPSPEVLDGPYPTPVAFMTPMGVVRVTRKEGVYQVEGHKSVVGLTGLSLTGTGLDVAGFGVVAHNITALLTRHGLFMRLARDLAYHPSEEPSSVQRAVVLHAQTGEELPVTSLEALRVAELPLAEYPGEERLRGDGASPSTLFARQVQGDGSRLWKPVTVSGTTEPEAPPLFD